ncbi:inositol monophosphatase family protein [Bifidobacterium pullorum subsp. saeculare]|uniref:Inositol monophosphatase family protein n=1 Tax=Bifidobacterium pullorum subsp. saeculare TaxID=78257 RepID=A0A938WV94_9BIFI|nr:inositol monophosphatase family protein [Bifidobacterium pullorum]MBM6698844.1 inositol monophosphatase family protein [Bifidobacterium pullorum subsp. saeculare]
MELRDLTKRVAEVAQAAGEHALHDQANPHDLSTPRDPNDHTKFTAEVDGKLVRYIETKLAAIDPLDGWWRDRPDQVEPGQRFWCVGTIDGAINYIRNMSEWTVTISMFEVNEERSARPMIGVVRAPALGLTYMAARDRGAIRVRRTPLGEKSENIMPSITDSLDGAVISYGMSYIPEESKHALEVVAALAGRPSDIKRVGPASLDLCKVADGTYDAYFEPHLHAWDVPAVSAGGLVLREAQGYFRRWNGDHVHWRSENDVVATNGLINDDLMPYLKNHWRD